MGALYLLDLYRNVGMKCRYSIPKGLDNDTLLALFDQAVAKTVLDHPLMQVGLWDEDWSRPSYLRLDSIDFSKVVFFQKLSEEGDEYEKQLHKTYTQLLDAKLGDANVFPGWQIHIFRSGSADTIDVLFVFRHTMGDGNAGKAFHQSLLKHVRSGGTCSDLEARTLRLNTQASDIPLAQEKLGKFSISPKYTIESLWEELKPARFMGSTPTFAHWAPYKTGLETVSRTVWVEKQDLGRILEVCREHKMTLTVLLHGIALLSMVSRLDKNTAPAFTGNSAVDLRRFIPTTPDGNPTEGLIDNLVTVMDHVFGVDFACNIRKKLAADNDGSTRAKEEIIWEAAAIVREDFQAKIKQGLKNDIMGLMKMVPDWREENKNILQKPRKIAWHISNIGVLREPMVEETSATDAPEWHIERAHFAGTCEVSAGAFSIYVISAERGGLCIDVISQRGTVDAELADGLREDFGKWIAHFAATD